MSVYVSLVDDAWRGTTENDEEDLSPRLQRLFVRDDIYLMIYRVNLAICSSAFEEVDHAPQEIEDSDSEDEYADCVWLCALCVSKLILQGASNDHGFG